MHDIVFKDGEAILPGKGRTTCDIAVRDGRIAAIAAPGEAGDAKETVSVKGLIAFPGVIDAHLHLGHGKDISRPRVPLDADRETAAAAKGGVTCIIPYLLATEPYENQFKDFQFGYNTMLDHWATGLADIRETLAHPEWLDPPQNEAGFASRDVHAPGSNDGLGSKTRAEREAGV